MGLDAAEADEQSHAGIEAAERGLEAEHHQVRGQQRVGDDGGRAVEPLGEGALLGVARDRAAEAIFEALPVQSAPGRERVVELRAEGALARVVPAGAVFAHAVPDQPAPADGRGGVALERLGHLLVSDHDDRGGADLPDAEELAEPLRERRVAEAHHDGAELAVHVARRDEVLDRGDHEGVVREIHHRGIREPPEERGVLELRVDVSAVHPRMLVRRSDR
ncbi:MAG TPA: hypothetical protein DEF51_53420 [Myxococcales bacterium]|nr:hypothetical protein [Myxococcales bacterium]